MNNLTLLIFTILLTVSYTHGQIYVNTNATGANDGTSWTNAYTELGTAINAATANAEIWVAQGSYNPTRDQLGNIPSSNLQKTFKISTDIKIFGGFAGTETLVSQRNWKTNVTVLEGTFSNGDQAYHILFMDGLSNQAELDGFTIQNGLANTTSPDDRGAAIYLDNSSPIISNCILKNNSTNTRGGAVYASSGSPQFISCTFNDNDALASHADGGAIYLTSCTNAKINNCLFYNNLANRYGGAISITTGTTDINNCTFTNNTGSSSGKAVRTTGGPITTIKNCIFFNNYPAARHDDVTATSPPSLIVSNCLTEQAAPLSLPSGSSYSNMIIGQPNFVDINNNNYNILCGPAVNAGDTTGLILPNVDLDGQPRIAKGSIDIGAYENQDSVGIEYSSLIICTGDYVRLSGTCDSSFTWDKNVVDGVPFIPTSTDTYTCTGSKTGQTAQITITVITLNDEALTAPSAICIGDSTTVSIANSVTGASYVLRNDADSTIIDGPIVSTGGAMNFNTGPIHTPTTYNVYSAPTISQKQSNGTALDFDGIDDKVATSLLMPTTSNFSIEAWIYPRATSSRPIIANYLSSPTSSRIAMETYGGQNSFNNGKGLSLLIGNNRIFQKNVLTLNTWNHVTATFDNGTIRLYVDGVLIKTGIATTTTLQPSTSGATMTIGSYFSSSSYFNGKMDDIRIWNKTLTASDITTNMNNCLDGTETDLLTYYDFEDGTNSPILTDKVANNHGTLTNMDSSTVWTAGTNGCGLVVSKFDGHALKFDGTDNRVNTSLTMPITQNFSVEAWINPNGNQNSKVISNAGYQSNAGFDLQVLTGNTLKFRVGYTTFQVSNALVQDQWNHVAATFDQGTIVLFVNGFSIGSGSGTTATLSSGLASVTFGEGYTSGAANFAYRGMLDEVRVWSKTLTQTDIMNNMNTCLTGTESDLHAYYNFNEGNGLILHDSKVGGTPHHGILKNMNLSTDWINGKFACHSACDQGMTQVVTITPGIADTSVSLSGITLTANATGASYQWIDCNTNAAVSGETNQNFTPTASGDYAVVVTHNGCTDTSACFNVLVTNIETMNNNNDLIIYPNPTTGKLTIDLMEVQEDITVEVHNMVGQLIEQMHFSSTQRLNLNLTGASGIYMVTIRTASGIQTTARINKR